MRGRAILLATVILLAGAVVIVVVSRGRRGEAEALCGWTLETARQAKGAHPAGKPSYDWWTTSTKGLCFLKNGKLNGPALSWYEDSGRKRCQGQHKGGVKVGVWLHWDTEGKLIAEGTYRDGKPWEGTFIELHRWAPTPTTYVKGVCQPPAIR